MIPEPKKVDDVDKFVSNCELYDGDGSTAGVCQGYITSTQKCMRGKETNQSSCNGKD